MSTHAIDNRPARDRLLDAASELFYEHGVHTVGIDTIIERAAVAKATLYSAFGSKEELVRAYLQARHASRRATVLAEMALHDDPRRKLLALFDVLATTVKQPVPSKAAAGLMPGAPSRQASAGRMMSANRSSMSTRTARSPHSRYPATA